MITLLATALAVIGGTATPQAASVPTLVTGSYRLYWDDQVDNQLVNPKSCELVIDVKCGRVVGTMRGLGDRLPVVLGNVDATAIGSVVSFRQLEGDYVCSYQMILQPLPQTSRGYGDARPVYPGIWSDSKLRHGDFALFKLQ